jgi:hypothetical protein
MSFHFFPVLYNTRFKAPAPSRLFVSFGETQPMDALNWPKHHWKNLIPHAQTSKDHIIPDLWLEIVNPNTQNKEIIYLLELEYLVTALVPSETACLASSPGRINRTLWNCKRWLEMEKRDDDLRGLDLSGWDGGLLGVCGELASLSGNTFEDIYEMCQIWSNEDGSEMEKHTIDERVQDRHGTVWDTSIWVNLLQHWRRISKGSRREMRKIIPL